VGGCYGAKVRGERNAGPRGVARGAVTGCEFASVGLARAMLLDIRMGQARPFSGGHRHTVLLVDDCAAVRRSLDTALSFCRCDVTTAASGEEALELLRAGLSPCVVLLDLSMLHGGALEFRDAWRAEPRLADIPVVVQTGMEEVPAIARALGARGWLVKPPDLNELLGLIARLCGEDEAKASSRGAHSTRSQSQRASHTPVPRA